MAKLTTNKNADFVVHSTAKESPVRPHDDLDLQAYAVDCVRHGLPDWREVIARLNNRDFHTAMAERFGCAPVSSGPPIATTSLKDTDE